MLSLCICVLVLGLCMCVLRLGSSIYRKAVTAHYTHALVLVVRLLGACAREVRCEGLCRLKEAVSGARLAASHIGAVRYADVC